MDERTRTLRNVCEPIGANVYFAPEAHERYAKLGLQAMGSGYFCSRAASMGRPSGLVVTAAFGVFSPAIVVPLVDAGWAATEPAPLRQARYDGAVASLRRLLGEPDAREVGRAVEALRRGLDAAEGAGHALFSGLKGLSWPEDPVGQLWRCCDMVREHRGDSHIAVWTRAMIAPIEIQLMSELQMGIPLKTYSATRGWTVEQMDAALDGMRAKGWMDGDGFSPAGRALREEIESDTDAMEVPIVEAMGDDFGDVIAILRPWAAAIVKAGVRGGGYPGGPDAIRDLGQGAGASR
ncbi:MAG TPA: hypothetical protein VIE40_02050 [Dehalococcoidia bacterium]|jgi:hypothetical protein